MIKYQDYLTEELNREIKRAVSCDQEGRSSGFNFLIGMRHGAFFASGMESIIYKKIDHAISEVINQREQTK